jgi:hypothetical protein
MPNDQSHNYSQDKSKKVAVMTRAADGIGKSIAIAFARAGRITAIHFNIIPLKLGETSGTFIPNRSLFDIPTFIYILPCPL